MRPQFRPDLESFEARTLLSRMPWAGVLATPALIRLQAPPQAQSPLVVMVTTDRRAYRIGQPVQITVTETNTSDQPVTVLVGCQILKASVSNTGGAIWVFRDLRLCPTGRGVLEAGQSRQFVLVWNGQPNIPGGEVLPGRYRVQAGVDGVFGATTIRIKP
ncbi:MAG: hypothetical protein IRY99_11230 [Isosphaeraceae bacterium]|nr:hypothetical protein [Isosphaeraceae bacterium]